MSRHQEEPVEVAGTVIFLMVNEGTKSEGRFPFLYVNRDAVYKLYLRGDNPFENNGLLPYDGKRVRVSGVKTENTKKSYAAGTLTVDAVAPEGRPEDQEKTSGSE
jgi:hypothetical protein